MKRAAICCSKVPLLVVFVSAGFGWIQSANAGVRLLGYANGRSTRVLSISHDGSVAVGNWQAANGNYVAARWVNGVRSDCTFGESNSMYAYAVSADGRYMTGFSGLPTNGNAFRVDESWNLQDLGRPSTAFGPATGTDLSDDGSVVVGYFRSTTTLNRRAFRWSATEGIVNIGHIWGNTSGNTLPGGVSADGRIIVGTSSPGSYFNPGYAFYWTQSAGMQALPMVGGGPAVVSTAGAISGDGRVIIGGATNHLEGILWHDLVPEYIPSSAEWIVRGGFALDYTGEHALVSMAPSFNPNTYDVVTGVFTRELGPMLPRDYFRHFGIDIPESAQLDIRCISGDGRSFGGVYYDPAVNLYQGVVITVPGAGSMPLIVGALLVAQRRRRPRCACATTRISTQVGGPAAP